MNTKNNFSFPVLEHPAPQCDTNEAHELASEWMEISEDTTITPLVSERDRNFLISTGGEKAILKISNHKEKKGVLEFQNEALLHLESSTSLSLPRVKKAKQASILSGKRLEAKNAL